MYPRCNSNTTKLKGTHQRTIAQGNITWGSPSYHKARLLTRNGTVKKERENKPYNHYTHMQIIKKGNLKGKKLLLIAGMISHYEHLFDAITPYLEAEYCLLYVKFNGAEGMGTFTDICTEASQIADCICADYDGEVFGALGVSMGANVLVELITQNRIKIHVCILDSPFLSVFPKWICHFYAHSMAKGIAKNGMEAYLKKMMRKNTLNLDGTLDTQLSYQSIYNQGFYCHRQHLRSELKTMNTRLHGTCGEYEKWALKSFHKIEKIRPIELTIFPNCNHGDMMLNNPKGFANAILSIIGN